MAKTTSTPYTILGVAEGATHEQVSARFRTLSRELHPDATGGDPRKAERFATISAAYNDLKSPARRAKIDKEIRGARARATRESRASSKVATESVITFVRQAEARRKRDGQAMAGWLRKMREQQRMNEQLRRAWRTRAVGSRRKASRSPFLDLAASIARTRPKSERLGWAIGGAAADLLWKFARTRRAGAAR